MRPKLAILARQFSGRDSKTQDDSDKEEGRQEVKDTKRIGCSRWKGRAGLFDLLGSDP